MSVVEEEVGDSELAVVGDGLVEGALREGDMLCLTLDEHQWLQLLVIHHGIAAFLRLSHGDSDFHADTPCGVVVVVHQPMEKLLPDPLLGGQPHPSPPPCAEDVLFAVDIFCIEPAHNPFALSPTKVLLFFQICNSFGQFET